jgi:Cft2 family RNA processing exonuclease
MQAEIPPTNVDILISESTFGISTHSARNIR